MHSNQDVIEGKVESFVSICCNCHRLMGSHEALPLADDKETLNLLKVKPIGYCPICSNDAAKWNVFLKKDYDDFCKENGKTAEAREK